MIVDLPDTTTSAVLKTLSGIREEGGVVALGRVLTLVISASMGDEEEAIEAANDASREHPMRVIVVSTERDRFGSGSAARMDAQIRVGGDSGASEVLVLKAYGAIADDEAGLVMGLLLPDAPVVAWWPQQCPTTPSASSLGRIAQRRITDAAAATDPMAATLALGESYRPGDTDFAWTRLTLWRAQLAAVLDQPPYESVTAIEVVGSADSPSTHLLAGWLALQLQAPVTVRVIGPDQGAAGIRSVRLTRASGTVTLERTVPGIAELSQPGQPLHDISLPRRPLRDCLAEELRRLDPDEVYGAVVREGVPLAQAGLSREGV